MITCALLLAFQDAAVPGEIRTHATATSIGIEWDLAGDADHDAACAVEVREKGQGPWRPSLGLLRIDFRGWYDDEKADRAYTMVAGSLFHLKPGASYEVKLDLADPDGGAASKTLEIRTRSVAAAMAGGRTLHVVPGAGGGDGSQGQPFKGLAAAKSAARPGDVILLGAGEYGEFYFNRSGEPGKPIVLRPVAPGAAVFSALQVDASHLLVESLSFVRKEAAFCLTGQGKSAEVTVRRSTFKGFHYAIRLSRDCRDWTIEDNVIVGDNDPVTGGLDGEGVELNHSDGHVVAHNRISRTADGVSYPGRNCDLYGNDIFDVSDDGIEPDYGYANIRIWGNRLTNCKNASISFQPMFCGPWYFFRNQVVSDGILFKHRVTDRAVIANNTLVSWKPVSERAHHFLLNLSRNNLFISAGGKGPVWAAYRHREPRFVIPDQFQRSWKTDVDYDGFDWGDGPMAFRWDDGKANSFKDLAAFAAATGVEKHGRQVRKEEIFENWVVPAQPGRVDPTLLLTLKAGSNAVDAGAPLPGLVDDFAGKAPDLGALESGKPLPLYGPRP